ncbi:hypothetical protein RND71_003581 [Anisodus tanguticus]|uniref:Disease resistance R13L4/SHOC-2-like LRR domain-containing protein n=1 Tax=Anisodus tanguticus TaxID=243964 RepID=A0AAE1SWX5_9SOLA|nr:hypothetical protein RND71_003581 [Anisodus tanguticus]
MSSMFSLVVRKPVRMMRPKFILVVLQVLDLRFCSITGVIPSTLGNLNSLGTLYLSNNGLSGMVPSSLNQLSSLSVLDLSHNSLVGSIPASFGSLGNLPFLDMSSNNLSGAIPLVIGTLSQLKFLNLSNNSLSSSIPAQLGDLSNLVDLDLSLNSLAGVVPNDLRGLRNLRRMTIGKISLSGFLPRDLFVPLTQLQFLAIDHNNLSGMFKLSQNKFYGNLPRVVIRRFSFLDLSDNYFQGEVPEYGQTNVSLDRNCLQRLESQRSTSECASFYDERGLIFNNFGVPNAMEPPAPKSDETSHKNVIILAAVLGDVGFIAIVVLIFCCCKRGSTNQKVTGVEPVPTSACPGASSIFQILQTTGEFSDVNLIKHGHSGDLFRGILEGGIHVVVKRIVKKEAYLLKLDLFSKVSHSRVVPLLVHCLENENEKFLVYKHMPNGDLSSSLFRITNSDDDSLQSLDWITRLKIAIGAAEDVQASSIFLDDKFEVRLGSLNEACAQEGDPHQNRISRCCGCHSSPNATCAYDVYCFGKVLLELVTGKLDISASSDATMKERLNKMLPCISIYDKELVTNIIDPSLIVDEDLLEKLGKNTLAQNDLKQLRPEGRGTLLYYGANKVERASSFKQSATTGSQGSGQIAEGRHSFSTRRHSNEIFPEPLDAERKRDE